MKKVKGRGWYYALLCYGVVGDPLVCGVFCSKKEAEDYNDEDMKRCGGGHKVKRCRIQIIL